MNDPISQLGYREKTTRQLRSLLRSTEVLHDVLDVVGEDPFHANVDGVLRVSSERLAILRTKILGKPTVDEFAWPEVSFELLLGVPLLQISTSRGQWRLGPGASQYGERMSRAERDSRLNERLAQLENAMRDASRAAV
jgi:hypothetical protein